MPIHQTADFTNLIQTASAKNRARYLPRSPAVYAAKYAPKSYRVANPAEISALRIARDLKIPTRNSISIAASAMAALIEGPCWLIPVPASNRDLSANLALAGAIAKLVHGARINCAVIRIKHVESSYTRRSRGLPGLSVNEHAIIRNATPMEPLPAYFVDNVVTTGATIEACRRALGWGTGLVFADASTYYNMC